MTDHAKHARQSGENLGLFPRERDAALEIAERVRRAGGEEDFSLREVRDAFGLPRGVLRKRRPSAQELRIVVQALGIAGVYTRASLTDVRLDERFLIAAAEQASSGRIVRSRWWRFATRQARAAYGVIAVLVTLGTFVGFFLSTLDENARTGAHPTEAAHLVIAVAGISSNHENDPVPKRINEAFGERLAKKLQNQLNRRAPDLGAGTRNLAATVDSRQATPESLSTSGVDVLLAASVTQTAAGVTIEPTVILTARALPGAEELAGTFSFGAPFTVRGDLDNPVTIGEIEDGLARRILGLSEFAVGLGRFEAHQYVAAYKAFRAAGSAPAWGDKPPAFVDLFLGNAALKQGRLRRAVEHLTVALRRAPGFKRARFARTEALFLRDKGKCERGAIHAEAVQHALASYTHIASELKGTSRRALRLLLMKSRYGAGRAYLCLSQALVSDRWAQAKNIFEEVIAEHDPNSVEQAETAAQAYAGLALVAMPARGDLDPKASLEIARRDYEKGIEVLGGMLVPPEPDSLQAILLGNLASVSQRLGEPQAAREQLQRAVALEQDPKVRREYQDQLRLIAPYP